MFNFMNKFKSHLTVQAKYNRIVDKGYVNTSNKEITTEFGEYYAKDGSIRIDGILNEATNYMTSNIYDLEHKQAIEKYRYMSTLPEVDDAIEEIINEAIIMSDYENEIVRIDFKEKDLFSEELSGLISDEFAFIRDSLLHFNMDGQKIFKQWYVDGCLYVEKVFDPANIRGGIKKCNILDSYYVTYYSVVNDNTSSLGNSNFGLDTFIGGKIIDEFFIVKKPNFSSNYYNSNSMMFNIPKSGIATDNMNQLKVPVELIAYIDSGLYHPNKYYPYSYLHKGLKVANQLTLLEDALLIYRITRAPERRIFFIEVGNMAPLKAEEYIRKLMRQYRQDKIYDVNTGTIQEKGAFLAMTEDFWLPRRNGQSTTEVTTLQGGQNLSEVEDLNYFANKIWRALNVPYTRRADKENNGVQFNSGRELTIEELKFFKFIMKLRREFSNLFFDLLSTQLIAKRIVNAEELETVLANIKFIFTTDNYFTQYLKLELMNNKLDVINSIDGYVGKYFSKEYVWKEICEFTEEEVEYMKLTMEDEREEDAITNPGGTEDLGGGAGGSGGAPSGGGGGGGGGGGDGIGELPPPV